MANEVFIQGDERVLYIKFDGSYVPVGCLTSNPINESSETIPTTTRQSNGWQTSLPTKQSFSIDFDGIQILTSGVSGDATKLSYDRLKLIKRNREQIEWKIEDADNNFIDIGYGYIVSIGESNTVGEILSFNGSIQGYGMPTASSTPELYLFEDGQPYLFEDTLTYQFNV